MAARLKLIARWRRLCAMVDRAEHGQEREKSASVITCYSPAAVKTWDIGGIECGYV